MKIFDKMKEKLREREERKYKKIIEQYMENSGGNLTKKQIEEIMKLGFDTKESYPEVSKKCFEAMENYTPYASTMLAAYYMNKNDELHEKYCLKAAKQGEKVAHKSLIIFYAKKNDEKQMLKWHETYDDKEDYDVLAMMSNYYMMQDNYQKVKEINLIVLKNSKNDIYAPSCLGDAYFMENDFENAEEMYLKAIKSGSLETISNLVRVYTITEDYKKAEKWVKKAINEFNKIGQTPNEELLHNAANLYIKNANFFIDLENYDKVEENLLVLAEKLKMSQYYYELSKMFKSIGNKEKYEKYLTIGAKEEDVNCLFSLAMYLFSKNKEYSTEIDTLLKKAAEKGHPTAMYELGLFAQERDEMEEAKKWYKRAVRKNHLTAMNNLGNIYELEGNSEEALKLYFQAAKENNELALLNLGIYYENKGEIEKATEYYKKTIEYGHSEQIINHAKEALKNNVR